MNVDDLVGKAAENMIDSIIESIMPGFLGDAAQEKLAASMRVAFSERTCNLAEELRREGEKMIEDDNSDLLAEAEIAALSVLFHAALEDDKNLNEDEYDAVFDRLVEAMSGSLSGTLSTLYEQSVAIVREAKREREEKKKGEKP